ncbi:MAG: hypothetical protein PVF83_15095 [Anaerolineales bacterium]|jgi:hypothetical protein
MTSLIYNEGKKQILDGGIDLLNDTIKVALVTGSYTPDKDTHEDFGDIDNEVSGSGYDTGGNALTWTGGEFNENGQAAAVSRDDTNDRAVFNADDVTWGPATITARAAIIYKSTGTDSTSTLIAYVDFGKDYSASSEDFTIEWDSEGILYLGE